MTVQPATAPTADPVEPPPAPPPPPPEAWGVHGSHVVCNNGGQGTLSWLAVLADGRTVRLTTSATWELISDPPVPGLATFDPPGRLS